jgi:hypothetical protein
MTPDDDNQPNKPLTRCPCCASKLIYPVAVLSGSDGNAIVDRRCPECEARDTVVTTADAAAVWLHHQAQLRTRLRSYLVSA